MSDDYDDREFVRVIAEPGYPFERAYFEVEDQTETWLKARRVDRLGNPATPEGEPSDERRPVLVMFKEDLASIEVYNINDPDNQIEETVNELEWERLG